MGKRTSLWLLVGICIGAGLALLRMGQTYFAGCLLIGVGLALIFGILRNRNANKPLPQPTKTQRFLSSQFNLFFIVASFAIAVYALNPGGEMTHDEIIVWVNRYFTFVFIIGGILLGTFILYLIEWFMELSKTKREREIQSIAYTLWQNDGRPIGRHEEHWRKAEAIWNDLQKNKGEHK